MESRLPSALSISPMMGSEDGAHPAGKLLELANKLKRNYRKLRSSKSNGDNEVFELADLIRNSSLAGEDLNKLEARTNLMSFDGDEKGWRGINADSERFRLILFWANVESESSRSLKSYKAPI
jgi:hypothetical protein